MSSTSEALCNLGLSPATELPKSSYIQLVEDLVNDLNDNCLNKDSQEFCPWNDDDFQVDNQRDYCKRVWYGCCHGFNNTPDSHTELCENCEKRLSKSTIKLLNSRIKDLEIKVSFLQKQIDEQKITL